MKKQFQGIVVYFVVILAFMWLFEQFSGSQAGNTVYSYTQFVEAVEAGEVLSAKVSQNKEIPTGLLQYKL